RRRRWRRRRWWRWRRFLDHVDFNRWPRRFLGRIRRGAEPEQQREHQQPFKYQNKGENYYLL
ncbi:hypothetical protein, partial [Komagataeibacter intermedius]|uniref:hypothetical protein n=1 Tax=Komagataeibacter intermedius TaxID=66229 RepID=UPI001AE0923E